MRLGDRYYVGQEVCMVAFVFWLNNLQGVPRTAEELEKLFNDHKNFEDILQAYDVDVSNVKELFRQLPNPTPTQRANHEVLDNRWEDIWQLSQMYVERLKVLKQVLGGIDEVGFWFVAVLLICRVKILFSRSLSFDRSYIKKLTLLSCRIFADRKEIRFVVLNIVQRFVRTWSAVESRSSVSFRHFDWKFKGFIEFGMRTVNDKETNLFV